MGFPELSHYRRGILDLGLVATLIATETMEFLELSHYGWDILDLGLYVTELLYSHGYYGIFLVLPLWVGYLGLGIS